MNYEDLIDEAYGSLDGLLDNLEVQHALRYGWLLNDIFIDDDLHQLMQRLLDDNVVLVLLDNVSERENFVVKVCNHLPAYKRTRTWLYGIKGFVFMFSRIVLKSKPVAASSHYRINIPPGLSITNLRLRDAEGKVQKFSDKCRIIATKQKVELHNLDLAENYEHPPNVMLQVSLKPDFTSFSDRALSLCGILLAFLGAIYIFADTNKASQTEIFAMAIAISAFIVAMPLLFRSHTEPMLVSSLLTESRFMLGVLCIFSIFCGLLCAFLEFNHKFLAIPMLLLSLYFVIMLCCNMAFLVQRHYFYNKIERYRQHG